MAVHRGLVFVEDSGLLPVSVENDAQVVVNYIKSGEALRSHFGQIIDDILRFLDRIPYCEVAFAPRCANMAAHNLVKIGLFVSRDLFLSEEVPESVISTVMGDTHAIM
ncbi:hypothetical protein Ddye_028619 [Dipteronia dyeriana]|uniref:RNase H type-1 domain-containing protein n=1 Tax=Dipteronia dyeriana TaxID=168575 RepID=A0AAD9WKP5_9ROSI|nr:hypothetical protein Ddye_028619 [Dipteronia dyeriana]